ncbi:MAG TPA: hypothetical protein VIL09_11570 [Microvirga sp.]|jgi:hypothetical protein
MLLRLNAELFVAAPARDMEAIRAFEAIALGFLPRVEPAAALEVAHLVAPCPDTPAPVLDALIRLSGETRAVVAAVAPRLSAAATDLLLGMETGRTALATRPDLDARTIERLLVLHDADVDTTLAANRHLVVTDDGLRPLLDRARGNTVLARALLARGDLPLSEQAILYCAGDTATRAAIRQQVAASALFRRPHLPFRASQPGVERLLAAASAGDVPAFEAQLTASLNLPLGVEWRALEPERQDLLAFGMKALGLDEEDALRALLTLHPAVSHSVEAVFALVRTFRTVARPTALALLEAVLGAEAATERPGRHLPAQEAGNPRPQTGLAEAPRRNAEDRQRRAI